MEIFGPFLSYPELLYTTLAKTIYRISFMTIIDIASSTHAGEISRLMYAFLPRFKNCCGSSLYFTSHRPCSLLPVLLDSTCDDN